MTKKVFFSVITDSLNWKIFTNNLAILKDRMGLRMKNFNIIEVPRKIQTLSGASRRTIVYMGELPKKGGGLGQCANLSGGLVKKKGGVSEEGLKPQCAL